MGDFFGDYECKLDDKGRIALPAKLKMDLLGDQPDIPLKLTLVRGFDPCIFIYLEEEWDKFKKVLQNLNQFNEKHRRFQRTLLRGCTELEPDKSGRFSVPKLLSKYASLEKDVIIAGGVNRLEIWNPDLYEEYMLDDVQEFSLMTEEFLTMEEEKSEAGGMVVNINPPSDNLPQSNLSKPEGL